MGDNELIMLPIEEYVGLHHDDPIKLYNRPVFGKLYIKRVELCLEQCCGGERILEVGYGAGVTFFNLSKKYREVHGIDLRSEPGPITSMFQSRGVDVMLKQGDLLDLPYPENFFDTVLLISILEHLTPDQLVNAFSEVCRVLRPGGQMVYGTPVERGFTRIGFLILGYDISKYHFSNEKQIRASSQKQLAEKRVTNLRLPLVGLKVYEVGDFVKS